MEPSSGLPQDQQPLFSNSTTLVAEKSSEPQHQPLMEEQGTQLLPCVKQNTLDSQSQNSLQTSTQLFPSVQSNNNKIILATASSSGIGNANNESICALDSTATAISATTQTATAYSGSSLGHHHLQQHNNMHQVGAHILASQNQHCENSASCRNSTIFPTAGFAQQTQPQAIEKLSRPMAFDKVSSCFEVKRLT